MDPKTPFRITFEVRPDPNGFVRQRITMDAGGQQSTTQVAHDSTALRYAVADFFAHGFREMLANMGRDLPAADRDRIVWFLDTMAQAARDAQGAVSRAFDQGRTTSHLNRFDGADDPLRDRLDRLAEGMPR